MAGDDRPPERTRPTRTGPHPANASADTARGDGCRPFRVPPPLAPFLLVKTDVTISGSDIGETLVAPPLDSAAYQASAVEHLHDGVYFVDAGRRIVFWNRAAERISGYTAADVVGRHCSDNILRHVNDDGTPLCLTACPLARTIADGQIREADVFLFHKDGHRQPVSIRTAPVRNDRGQIVGAVEVFSDSAELQAARKKVDELARIALIDDLTGVGNRRYLERNLRAKVDEAARYGSTFGVLFLDIDHFKRVNDEYGHTVGDAVLKMVAQTVNDASRIFDVVGRWGGEEFVIIAVNVTATSLLVIAERFRSLIEQSALPIPGGQLKVTVSIGTLQARASATAFSLVEEADRLMYEAKHAGGNCVRLGPAQ
jgi:diguanylate cyclase (GGDEF)-like protein/PAS domain S-box-containing protein